MSTAHARSTDPATSQAAGMAAGIEEVNAGTHAHRALKEIADAGRSGLTADEVEVQTRVNGIWKRVSDLKRLGYVEPDGRERKGRAGFECEVVVITAEGLERLDALANEKPKRARRKTLTRDQRVLNLIEEWMEQPPSLRGTRLTRAEKFPVHFAREVRKTWES